MSFFKKTTVALALVAASAMGTPALAAMQTVDAVGYTFSFDDVLWGQADGTAFSSVGNVFTFANLGYATSSTVSRSGSQNSSFSAQLDRSVAVYAKAGYQITGVVSGVTGAVSATAGNGSMAEAGANVYAGVDMWLTDTGVGYLFPTQGMSADLIVGTGATAARNYSLTDAGEYVFLPGTTSATMGSLSLWGGTKTSGKGSTASASLNTASFAVTVSAVPEPETYAMLLAGLGLMGSMARRRKQKSAA